MSDTRTLQAASPLVWALECVRLPVGTALQPFSPYPYQAAFLADRSPQRLVLKARQTGMTEVAALQVAHETVFTPRALALVISRDQSAAAEVLTRVYDILDELGEPTTFERRGVFECTLGNGARIVAQPATSKAGRGYTASSVILDEFAFQEHDAPIFRAVLPTLSRGGRLTVISTPNGVNNHFYKLWAGDEGGQWSKHRIHWSDCPVLTPEWAQAEKQKHTSQSWASEYECDFTESGGAVFNLEDIDAMNFGWVGEQEPRSDRTYVSGWDIGRHKDATVGVTLDTTALPYQVVKYERLQRAPFAQIQSAITRRSQDYLGQTFVEANNTGDPVIEGLSGVGVYVTPFITTAATKANALTRLVRLVEQHQLLAGQEQLLSELRGYQWEDKNLVQDSVIALAIVCAGIDQGGAPNIRWLSW